MKIYLGTENLHLRIQHAKEYNYEFLLQAVANTTQAMRRYMEDERNIHIFQDKKERVRQHGLKITRIIKDFRNVATQ